MLHISCKLVKKVKSFNHLFRFCLQRYIDLGDFVSVRFILEHLLKIQYQLDTYSRDFLTYSLFPLQIKQFLIHNIFTKIIKMVSGAIVLCIIASVSIQVTEGNLVQFTSAFWCDCNFSFHLPSFCEIKYLTQRIIIFCEFWLLQKISLF